jgi:hypothetical protein
MRSTLGVAFGFGAAAASLAAGATTATPCFFNFPADLSFDDGADSTFVALRDARHVVLECEGAGCAAEAAAARIPLHGAESVIHLYELTSHSTLSLARTFSLPAAPDGCDLTLPPSSSSSPGPVLGVLYEGWQGYAANASATVAAMGGTPLAVEQVIESNGTLALADVWQKYPGVSGLTAGFYWQDTPQLGYYCIYRKRANESVGVLPDCANIPANVRQQALWLNAAGVDFVTADGTNLCTPSDFADAIQTRPFEVLLEEFIALRAAGVPTPRVAAWQRSITGCTLWSDILDIYNDPSYGPLIYTDPVSGKKVFFVPDSPDPSIVAQILSNGGRNDIVVQEMWALFDPALYAQGRWGFMSPCVDDGKGPGAAADHASAAPKYTTTVVGLGRGASGCGQPTTTNSTLGSTTTVSPGYQLSYGSVPFSGVGKYDGLVFKRQYGTVLDNAQRAWREAEAAVGDGASSGAAAAAAAAALPANIYSSSWNEFISQPQPNPFNSPNYSFSMGLPWDDAGRASLWVDTYGASLSRDIEPGLTHGTLFFDIMTSCMRVIRLAGALQDRLLVRGERAPSSSSSSPLALLASLFGSAAGDPATSSRHLTSCSVAGEACCAYNETTDGYAIVFSVQQTASSGGDDALLTVDPNEVQNLTCPSCGWKEVCNGYGGGSDFCIDQAVLTTPQAMQGPFALPSGGCGAVSAQVALAAERGAGGASGAGAELLSPAARAHLRAAVEEAASVLLPGRVPLLRCYDGTHHFVSGDVTCGGAVVEQTLGCMKTERDGNTPRALRACREGAGTGRGYHMLDAACVGGDVDGGVLGYVH